MQKQAKIIECQSLQGQSLQFIILSNEYLGTGYFGTVKKAYEQSHQFEELAVKIIPHNGKEQQMQNINKEVQILKSLPDHPNLVKVYPLKCWSQKNFYIFMEYCNQGTLQQKIHQKLNNKQNFTEKEIFKIFYEILSGYEVLWKKKILHQDLKPENILIKDGLCKITDFGFSIFYESQKMNKQRLGTLQYMPLEKLTRSDYFASTKSDIYSLGVIFFKMITGQHPYVSKQYHDEIDFIDSLKLTSLRPPTHLRGQMSIPMQHLFDLILKMVSKKDSQRIDFDSIYKFMQEQSTFLSFAENFKYSSKNVLSQKILMPEKNKFRFVEYSKAFAIPFSIPISKEKQYEELLFNQNLQSQKKEKLLISQKIDKYLCSMRLIVYFFDRLARKLTVQKMKEKISVQDQKQKMNKKQDKQQLDVLDKAIICLLYLSTKLTGQTLNDSRLSRVFEGHEWKIYKSTNPYILGLIKKDQEYLKALINELILQMQQNKIHQAQQLIEASKKSLLDFMKYSVRKSLFQLLQSKIVWIGLSDHRAWTTLNYILTAIDIIDNFNQRHESWQELENFFREMQAQEINQLYKKVTDGLNQLGLKCSFAEEWVEQKDR